MRSRIDCFLRRNTDLGDEARVASPVDFSINSTADAPDSSAPVRGFHPVPALEH
jgi:hypothetical protein